MKQGALITASFDHRCRKRQAGACGGRQHGMARSMRRSPAHLGGAKGADVTFMCGGEDKVFAGAGAGMARRSHCGGAGAGQAAKICNNMISARRSRSVRPSALAIEKLGLSHQALLDVASTSSGQCWAPTSYCPVLAPVPTSLANNDYKPGFASALMVKDLTLAQDAAKAAGAATPLGKHAQEIYKAFDASGHGGADPLSGNYPARSGSRREN